MNCNGFSEFYGNADIIERITTLIKSKKVPHAIIIEGDTGMGKKSLAELIAAALVCVSEGERPCMNCPECLRARAGSHPDISVLAGSGKTGGIPVDLIRQIRSDAYIVPSEAEKKVYILLNADSTGIAAQNAFLKLFEEPPAFAVFIITCQSAANLLETIRSRAVIFSLAPVSANIVSQAVHSFLPDVDEQTLERAALLCGGNIGKCMASLKDDNFTRVNSVVTDIVKGLVSPKECELLTVLYGLEKDRSFATLVFDAFELCLRDAVVKKCGEGASVSANSEALELLLRYINSAQLLSLIECCAKIKKTMERFAGMPLAMANACALLRSAVAK